MTCCGLAGAEIHKTATPSSSTTVTRVAAFRFFTSFKLVTFRKLGQAVWCQCIWSTGLGRPAARKNQLRFRDPSAIDGKTLPVVAKSSSAKMRALTGDRKELRTRGRRGCGAEAGASQYYCQHLSNPVALLPALLNPPASR